MVFHPGTKNPRARVIVSWRDPPSYECHDNMMSLLIAQGYFYSEHGRYTNSIEELGQSYRKCPECNYSYIVTGSETDYTISCPLPQDPDHGNIIDGIPSWLTP